MKRLLVLVLFLVIVSAVVFYFGWIQLELDEDSYGVIFTKTSGWEESVIVPGEFVWRGEKLLPTNLSLHVFPVTSRSHSASLQGGLPSAAVYASLLDASSPFDYNLRFTIVYKLDPTALPTLAKDDGLRADDLGGFYERIESGMDAHISEAVTAELETLGSSVSGQLDQLTGAIEDELSTRYPSLQIVSVSPARISLPDIGLYLSARDQYESVLDARATAMRIAAENLASEQAGLDAGLARLERYGEILEKYPILLDYFTLSQEFPNDPLDLEALIPQPGT